MTVFDKKGARYGLHNIFRFPTLAPFWGIFPIYEPFYRVMSTSVAPFFAFFPYTRFFYDYGLHNSDVQI